MHSDANTLRAENIQSMGGWIRDAAGDTVTGSSSGSLVGFGTFSHGLNRKPRIIITNFAGSVVSINNTEATFTGHGPADFVAM